MRPFQLPPVPLLAASFGSYAHGQPYLLLLLVMSALVAVATGYAGMASATRHARNAQAFVGVTVNPSWDFSKMAGSSSTVCGTNFSADGVLGLSRGSRCPVGISFSTFHGISPFFESSSRVSRSPRRCELHFARNGILERDCYANRIAIDRRRSSRHRKAARRGTGEGGLPAFRRS